MRNKFFKVLENDKHYNVVRTDLSLSDLSDSLTTKFKNKFNFIFLLQ